MLVQSQHGHIQLSVNVSLLLCFCFNLTVKLTVFLIRHTKKAPFLVMSSHAFKEHPSDTSLFYVHVGSYISQLFRFPSLTFPTHYAIIFLVLERLS